MWEQNFLALQLPESRFDGIFANATLFHVPSQELPRVLAELHATLKPRGVLFSSNPHGHNEEGWYHERYGVYHDLETWRRFMREARFFELAHYYRPAGLPRNGNPGSQAYGANRFAHFNTARPCPWAHSCARIYKLFTRRAFSRSVERTNRD